MIKERVIQLLEYKMIPKEDFYAKIGMTSASFRGNAKKTPLNSNAIANILSQISDVNSDWLLTGQGEMLKTEKPLTQIIKKVEEVETRPRIPMDAAAGSLSIAVDGVTREQCEEMPVIKAFSKYDFTILAKGDSMEPEYHSGDELACLYLKNTNFVQWGRTHVLDTAQGILVKRIFDADESILCKSDNEFYSDFCIHKSELYNIALVIGILRQY